MKDDSGAFAFFTEQGSSASQMTAAKVMDVIPGLEKEVPRRRSGGWEPSGSGCLAEATNQLWCTPLLLSVSTVRCSLHHHHRVQVIRLQPARLLQLLGTQLTTIHTIPRLGGFSARPVNCQSLPILVSCVLGVFFFLFFSFVRVHVPMRITPLLGCLTVRSELILTA